MAKLNIPPTKSNLLALKRQLAFAEEGYDLLDQKRQILIFELMSRLERTRALEQRVQESLRAAYAALREALLDIGSAGLSQAALGVNLRPEADLSVQSMMGLHLPHTVARIPPAGIQFGLEGTSASTDRTMQRFAAALPLLAELAELENSLLRLARELRKTQRRCNALSKIFIPTQHETISYISASLEERERESLTILKMIRNRLNQSPAPSTVG